MRPDLVKWHPIRLSLERAGNNRWFLRRAGELVGHLRFSEGAWWAMGCSGYAMNVRQSSFRTACLRLARSSVVCSNAEVQNYGTVRMIRVNVASAWFTVLFADQGDMYIYEDFTLRKPLNETQQTLMRQLLATAQRWRKENL